MDDRGETYTSYFRPFSRRTLYIPEHTEEVEKPQETNV